MLLSNRSVPLSLNCGYSTGGLWMKGALVGGLLAQTPHEPLLAAARGVVWHGMAADALARAHGQTSVVTTQVLDFLGVALRESAHEQ